jgi:hypothetical protein
MATTVVVGSVTAADGDVAPVVGAASVVGACVGAAAVVGETAEDGARVGSDVVDEDPPQAVTKVSAPRLIKHTVLRTVLYMFMDERSTRATL